MFPDMLYFSEADLGEAQRGEPGHPNPLILGKKRRRAGRASKTKPGPLLSSRSGSATAFIFSSTNCYRFDHLGKLQPPVMTCTGRLPPKGLLFSSFRNIKGKGFHKFRYMKG